MTIAYMLRWHVQLCVLGNRAGRMLVARPLLLLRVALRQRLYRIRPHRVFIFDALKLSVYRVSQPSEQSPVASNRLAIKSGVQSSSPVLSILLCVCQYVQVWRLLESPRNRTVRGGTCSGRQLLLYGRAGSSEGYSFLEGKGWPLGVGPWGR